MSLRTYLVKRFITAIVLFCVVLVFNFFLFRLPIFILGMDPMNLYIDPRMEPETIETLRVLYGIPPADADFNDWFSHFLLYLKNMITLDFGISFDTLTPVNTEVMNRLPNTLILMGTSTILSVLIGVVAGIVAASRHGGKLDTGERISV